MQFIEDIIRLFGDDRVRAEVDDLKLNLTIEQLQEMGLVARVNIDPYEDKRTVCSQSLRDIVISRLPKPPIVSADDLVAPFFETFMTDDDPEPSFDQSLEWFLDKLATLPVAATRRSEPLLVATGPFVAVRKQSRAYSMEPVEIFESESGFVIRLLGTLPAAADVGLQHGDLVHTACIQVEAECSLRALEAAIPELRYAFATLIRCGVVLSQERALQYFSTNSSAGEQESDNPNADESLTNELVGDESTGEDYQYKEEYMTAEGFLIDEGELGPWFHFIPDCLQAYYSHPTKKDSVSRRLTTAVRLLTQADMQAENGVGLALSIAATEALLCRKGSDLANMFAENATTLLEPEPIFRANAVQWCKRLYGLRSDVLHGSRFDAYPEDLRNARLLAAAVLKAMIERRNFQRKMEQPDETPDDLINEMRKDKWTPGQTTGVEESPVVAAWRS